MGKANRYDEFTIEEQEGGPPLVVDRDGRERPSTKVERALWEILNRDDDKARVAILKARIADLEKLLHRVIEWKPAMPIEASLADDIGEALGLDVEPRCIHDVSKHDFCPDCLADKSNA